MSLQACQWRDRQPPDRVRQGDGSYFRKPEGPEEGADLLPPPPPLKRLRPLEREEEDERLNCGLPAREEPAGEGSTAGEEEERPRPWDRDLDMARFEEINDDCCTWDTTTPSISSPKRSVSDPGDTVRERRWDSGQKGVTALSTHKCGAGSRGTRLLRQGRRGRGQGHIKERWVSRLEAVSLQHSEHSGQQPERFGGHL